uniref:Uncharacterized protein n=1 Tax=Panagrolaimus davidi TaxID=227884 RepID=A0A914PX34_9BILA
MAKILKQFKNYFVRVLSIVELLKDGCSVALPKYSNAVVDILPPEADSTIQMLRPNEKPEVSYADIGGLDIQKQEVREAVELSLTPSYIFLFIISLFFSFRLFFQSV